MDIAVLLVTMFFCFLIGVPIAYSLGLAAIAAAWWIGLPLEAVMLQISNGVSKVAMLTIPFFVLAGAIMAEGGMARRMFAFDRRHDLDHQPVHGRRRARAVARALHRDAVPRHRLSRRASARHRHAHE